MSAAPGLEPVGPRTASRPRRGAQLALVPATRPATAAGPLGRKPFVALVVALLATGLIGLLVLNTALAQDAFRLHTLKQDSRALEDREEALLREVERLRSPQELAARATDLGMVPAGPPSFLRLSDGAVLGADTPAERPQPVEDAAPDEAAAAEGPAPGTDGTEQTRGTRGTGETGETEQTAETDAGDAAVEDQ